MLEQEPHAMLLRLAIAQRKSTGSGVRPYQAAVRRSNSCWIHTTTTKIEFLLDSLYYHEGEVRGRAQAQVCDPTEQW